MVVALALGGACLGFLPSTCGRANGPRCSWATPAARCSALACAFALASSWTTGATLTSLLLPLLVLAIPILDTTLVTVRRTLERRPVTQGGTDHTSHRLVYYGLSEQQAVLGLTLLAALLGATGLAYTVLANPRVTAIGVLVSFVVLVQFASFLTDLEERSRRHEEGPPPALWRALVSHPRRLVEVLVDFAIICTSFLAAYLLFVDGKGTLVERAVFLSTLPVLLGVRYVLFVAFGIYRRVWRFAGPRDLVAIALATTLSAPIALGIVAKLRRFMAFHSRSSSSTSFSVRPSSRPLAWRYERRLMLAAWRRGPRGRALIVEAVARVASSPASSARPAASAWSASSTTTPAFGVVVSSASRSSAASTRRRCSWPPRGPTRCS